MLDQRERDDQGRKPPMIVVDHAQQLDLFLSGQSILEVAQNMLQHIHMLPYSCLHLKRLHEQFTVLHRQILGLIPFCLSHQLPHCLVVLWAMGEEQILVNGMEADQCPSRDPVLHQILKPAITKHPLNEVLSQ
jgi:hypothetical protein